MKGTRSRELKELRKRVLSARGSNKGGKAKVAFNSGARSRVDVEAGFDGPGSHSRKTHSLLRDRQPAHGCFMSHLHLAEEQGIHDLRRDLHERTFLLSDEKIVQRSKPKDLTACRIFACVS